MICVCLCECESACIYVCVYVYVRICVCEGVCGVMVSSIENRHDDPRSNTRRDYLIFT